MKEELPEYMVPSAFVRLEAMPLTPNGKADRKALPVPELDAYVARQYEAPQGETEQALASIWQELLGVERVGRHDNFFDLGGHSLLLARVTSRVQHVLGVVLPIRVLLMNQTIKELALTVDSQDYQGGDVNVHIEDDFDLDLEEEVMLDPVIRGGGM